MGTNDSAEDGDKFQVAVQLLEQLCQNGQLGAKEFSLHAGAIKSTIEEDYVKRNIAQKGESGNIEYPVRQDPEPQALGLGGNGAGITAGMALAEPSLQEFLAQPDFDLQLLDVPAFMGSEDPYGSELWGGTGWSPGF